MALNVGDKVKSNVTRFEYTVYEVASLCPAIHVLDRDNAEQIVRVGSNSWSDWYPGARFTKIGTGTCCGKNKESIKSQILELIKQL